MKLQSTCFDLEICFAICIKQNCGHAYVVPGQWDPVDTVVPRQCCVTCGHRFH